MTEPVYINIDSTNCGKLFHQALIQQLQSIDTAYEEICVACIGTDRCTGDSLGPLVGHKLSKEDLWVVGTLDKPLHAKNLEDFLLSLSEDVFVIAVDSCLGTMEHVGCIMIKDGPLTPGSGVGKALPPIGNVNISGIVNWRTDSELDYLILQNTRLSLVMKMADIIADGLELTLKARQRRTRYGA